jgi:hypothetical protein
MVNRVKLKSFLPKKAKEKPIKIKTAPHSHPNKPKKYHKGLREIPQFFFDV